NAAVGIEAGEVGVRLASDDGEVSGQNDFAVRLDRQRIDITVGAENKVGVNGAVVVEARDIGARLTARAAEASADDDLAIGLEGQAPDSTVKVPGAAVEGSVETTVGVETSDVVTSRPGQRREKATD